MAGMIGEGISHRGFIQETFIYPFYLTGSPVAADVGKAVSQDITAARSAKLAADGDVIIGELASVENRISEGVYVGSVAMKTGTRFTVKTGAPAVTLGQSICGAGAGEVRAALVGDASLLKSHRNMVTYVSGSTVEVIFF